MKVVLFCGGLGMRMREGTGSVPKPMSMIGDRPLVWHVMRYYAHFGHTEFILCLGYGAAAVKEYFLSYDETQSNDFTMAGGNRTITMHSTDITDWTITFLDTGLKSTIGERLMRVRAHVEDDEMFLANYADTLTDAPLDEIVAAFRASDAVASMLAVPPVSTHHVIEFDDDGRVHGVNEVRALRPVGERRLLRAASGHLRCPAGGRGHGARSLPAPRRPGRTARPALHRLLACRGHVQGPRGAGRHVHRTQRALDGVGPRPARDA